MLVNITQGGPAGCTAVHKAQGLQLAMNVISGTLLQGRGHVQGEKSPL